MSSSPVSRMKLIARLTSVALSVLVGSFAPSAARAGDSSAAKRQARTNAARVAADRSEPMFGAPQAFGRVTMFQHYAAGLTHEGPAQNAQSHGEQQLREGNHDWMVLRYTHEAKDAYGQPTRARVVEETYNGYPARGGALPGPTLKQLREPRLEVRAAVPKGSRIMVDGRRVTVTRQDRSMGNKVRITHVEAPRQLQRRSGQRQRLDQYRVIRRSVTLHRAPRGRPRRREAREAPAHR